MKSIRNFYLEFIDIANTYKVNYAQNLLLDQKRMHPELGTMDLIRLVIEDRDERENKNP